MHICSRLGIEFTPQIQSYSNSFLTHTIVCSPFLDSIGTDLLYNRRSLMCATATEVTMAVCLFLSPLYGTFNYHPHMKCAFPYRTTAKLTRMRQIELPKRYAYMHKYA